MTESFDAYYEWLGIPPKDQPPHLYRLLGVEVFETNLAVIENAADRQMAHLRTYQSSKHSALSQRLLNELAKAKVVLLNADKKATYDQALRKKLQPRGQAKAAAPAAAATAPTPAGASPVVDLAAPTIDAGPAPTGSQASSSLAGSSTLSRKPRKKKPPVWQHPAVLAGAISGGVVAIIGFAIFMFSGGSDEPTGNEGNGGNEVVAVDGGGNGGGTATNTNGGGTETPADPLAGTFGISDPVPASSFARPDIDTLDVIRLAWGLTSDDYALCQTADLGKLEEITAKMAEFGYRIDQLRPYRFNTNAKFAAIWRRDGRPFRCAVDKTADEIKDIDQRMSKRGFMPVDVAGYETDDGIRFAAIWWIPGVGGAKSEMTVGLTTQQSQGLLAKRKSEGWVPSRIQYCFPKNLARRECLVWRPVQSGEDVYIRTGTEVKFEQTTKETLPVNVSIAYDPERRMAQLSAVYDKTTKSAPAWEVLSKKSPRDTLPEMRQRMQENMEPLGLDVARLWFNRKAQIRSVSVWNLKKGATPNPRQLTVMSSHGAAGAAKTTTVKATADRLLSQGTGGVEVLNTDSVARLGDSFTAELITQLAQHGSQELEHVLMGTSRGNGPLQEGWQLIAREKPGSAAQMEFRYAGMRQPITRSVPGDFSNWRSVALGAHGTGALWTITLYLDGQPIVSEPIVKSALKPATNNLTIGVHPQGANGMRFYGGVRQFRLSQGDRYRQSSYPAASQLSSDAATLSLLDFKSGDSSRMEDLSGRNRAGFRRSTVWLADGASMPRHPGGAGGSGTSGDTGPTTPMNTGGGKTNVVETPARPVDRIKAPSRADIDAAVTEIRKVYEDDYKRAVTPAARVALADVLRKQANEETDVNSRYGLFKEAANAAASGNNVGLALSIVDEMESLFEGEFWADRSAMVTTAFKSARSRPEKISVAQSAFDIAQRAANEDQFDVAVKLYDTASSEARRAQDTELAKTINLRSRQVKAIRDEFRAAEAAKAKVDAGSGTDEDYLKLGKFLCYLRDEWKDGLPHLVKGSDQALATLAGDDLKNPTDGKAQSALGERWKTHADTIKGEDEKKAVLRRAYYWYSSAVPKLTGLTRAKVQREMNEIATLTGGVAVAGALENLAFLDVKPGKIHEFSGHSRDIRALAVSATGRYLASASYDGTVRLWDVATGQPLHTLSSTAGRTTFNGLAFTPDERFVLSGTSNDNVAAWDVRNGNPAFAIPATTNVIDVDVSDDGRKLIFATSTSSQPNLGVFGLAKRRPLGVLKSQSYPRHVRISGDGNKAVSVDSSNNVTLWNLVSFRPEANYGVAGSSVNDLAYSSDGRVVAIATTDDELLIWNPLSQKLEATLKDTGSFSSLRSVDLTRDGQHAVVADYYRGLVVWDIANQKVVGRIGGDTRRLSTRWRIVRLLPDPRGAIVGDTDGKIALFRLPDY